MLGEELSVANQPVVLGWQAGGYLHFLCPASSSLLHDSWAFQRPPYIALPVLQVCASVNTFCVITLYTTCLTCVIRYDRVVNVNFELSERITTKNVNFNVFYRNKIKLNKWIIHMRNVLSFIVLLFFMLSIIGSEHITTCRSCKMFIFNYMVNRERRLEWWIIEVFLLYCSEEIAKQTNFISN